MFKNPTVKKQAIDALRNTNKKQGQKFCYNQVNNRWCALGVLFAAAKDMPEDWEPGWPLCTSDVDHYIVYHFGLNAYEVQSIWMMNDTLLYPFDKIADELEKVSVRPGGRYV